MDKLVIQGGQPLQGAVTIGGAKNAVLPIMAAALLAETGVCHLESVPFLADVTTMVAVLEALQVRVHFDVKGEQLITDAQQPLCSEAPFELVAQMRASIVVLGPLLARLGHATIALPGGCAIGARPIDLHLKGLRALGAQITMENGNLHANAPSGLTGCEFYLDFPSVGATENLMMAATLAKGRTLLENVAREPEIVDLAIMLNKMGANISGAGTDTLKIEGVACLHGTTHQVVQDRIEAGTFMIAAAITQGDVLIKEAIAAHNRPLLSKLEELGACVHESEAGLEIVGHPLSQAVAVKTMPYPGFPTDLQPQMAVALLLAKGHSVLTETVFENRFLYLSELRRMNANYTIKGNAAFLEGNTQFKGAHVEAPDLRAGAALVLAGLVAQGMTTVRHLHYIDRGYVQFHRKLQALGAKIDRFDDSNTPKVQVL